MELIKLSDSLWVPEDFGKNHHYYADEKGEKEYTGITSILGVIAKPALIGWAARMAVEHIQNKKGEWEKIGIAGILAGDSPRGTFGKLWTDFSENLDVWLEEAKSAHTKKKDAAAEHGTSTHSLVEQWVLAEIKRYSATKV